MVPTETWMEVVARFNPRGELQPLSSCSWSHSAAASLASNAAAKLVTAQTLALSTYIH